MFGREFEYLTFARLLAMQGQIDAAQTVLKRLLNVTHESHRASLSLIILLTQALLFQLQSKPDAALQAVVDALDIGEKGDFVRSFLDIGTPLIPLLKTAQAQGIHSTYTQRLLTLMTTELPPQSPQPDTLSEREQEVLLLIANGLKNQAIADQLVISLNTVLYHTKNIYSKLHVTHRTQAVQRARELKLL
jgi:LuxR family maltose regulon positive regulatory protein